MKILSDIQSANYEIIAVEPITVITQPGFLKDELERFKTAFGDDENKFYENLIEEKKKLAFKRLEDKTNELKADAVSNLIYSVDIKLIKQDVIIFIELQANLLKKGNN